MCSNCAGDYENPDMTAEPLSPLEQAIADKDFEECLRILDEQERERVKLACVAGLLALGIMPHSLVRSHES